MRTRQRPNAAFTAALALLCLVLLSTSLTGGMWAKFVSREPKAADNARTAAFAPSAKHVEADLLLYKDTQYRNQWVIEPEQSMSFPPSPAYERTFTVITTQLSDGSSTTSPLIIPRDMALAGTPVTVSAAAGTRVTCVETSYAYRYTLQLNCRAEVNVQADITVNFGRDVTTLIDDTSLKMDVATDWSPAKSDPANGVYVFAVADTFRAVAESYSSAAPDALTDDTSFHTLSFELKNPAQYLPGVGFSPADKMIRVKLPADSAKDRDLVLTFVDTVCRDFDHTPFVDVYGMTPVKDGGGDPIPGSFTLTVPQGKSVTLAKADMHFVCTGAAAVSGDDSVTLSAAGEYTVAITKQTPTVYTGADIARPVESTSWDTAEAALGRYRIGIAKSTSPTLTLPYGVGIGQIDLIESDDMQADSSGEWALAAASYDRIFTVTCEDRALTAPANVTNWDASKRSDGIYSFTLPKGKTTAFSGLEANAPLAVTTVTLMPQTPAAFALASNALADGMDYDNNVISIAKGDIPFTVSVIFTQLD